MDAENTKSIPGDRHFAASEFEELYSQLPVIEYLFENGIELLDMALLNHIVNEIRELHPDWNLRIDSFQARSIPKAVFTIVDANLITHAFDVIKNKYESALQRLEGNKETSNRIMEQLLGQLMDQNKAEHIHHGDIVNTLTVNTIHSQNNNQLTQNQLILNDAQIGDLRKELVVLKQALLNNNTSGELSADAEQVDEAIRASDAKDSKTVIKHLAKVGKKSVEIAEKIGVSVASSVIKQHLGI